MPVKFDTEPTTWSINKLASSTDLSSNSPVYVDVPRFQRSIVWNEDQQRSLIESLFRGFPIGSLLLHEEPGTRSGKKQYKLVDGLQRTTTIRDYVRSPLTYAPAEELLPADLYERLEKQLAERWEIDLGEGDDLSDAMDGWLRQTKTTNPIDNFDWTSLLEHLSEELPGSHDFVADQEMKGVAQQIIQAIDDSVTDLKEVEIPIVIYKGDSGNLPDIFEKINASGTKLSKYEIYAAMWVSDYVRIENKKVRDAVEEKYQQLRERGYGLASLTGTQGGADQRIAKDRFTLFEYLFGLGKLLSNRYPTLFQEPGDPDETNPIAFVIAATAHRLKLTNMGELNRSGVLQRDNENVIIVDDFEDAVLEACDAVRDILAPYIDLKLNKRGSSRSIAHSQNQIASLIVRYMLARRTFKTWAPLDDGSQADVLRRTYPAHYLFDIVRQAWRGSGDNRLYDMCWRRVDGGEDEAAHFEVSSYYTQEIDESSWRDQLKIWFNDQLQKQQTARPSVRDVEKIFLKYVYTDIVTNLQEKQDFFDIEHLYPVARLTKFIGDGEPGWPMSCVGNLALFEESLNREKSKKTIHEYIRDDLNKDESLTEEERAERVERIRKYLIWPTPDQVRIPQRDGEDHFTRDEYIAFLEDRFPKLVDQVIKSLPD